VEETFRRLAERVAELELQQALTDRRVFDLERARETYVPVIEDLVDQDKIAKAISESLQSAAARGWTHRERLFALIGVAALLVNLILNVAGFVAK
jgi:hypothetical protein